MNQDWNQLAIFFRFEEKFRYDDEGLPKVWKPEDDIDAHFRKAREDVIFVSLNWIVFVNRLKWSLIIIISF